MNHKTLVRCVPELQLIAVLENKYSFNVNESVHREHVDVYYGFENNLCSDVQHIMDLSNAIKKEHPNCSAATQHVHYIDPYTSMKHRGKTMVSASISIFAIRQNPHLYQSF